jgi:hypothetical protein
MHIIPMQHGSERRESNSKPLAFPKAGSRNSRHSTLPRHRCAIRVYQLESHFARYLRKAGYLESATPVRRSRSVAEPESESRPPGLTFVASDTRVGHSPSTKYPPVANRNIQNRPFSSHGFSVKVLGLRRCVRVDASKTGPGIYAHICC